MPCAGCDFGFLPSGGGKVVAAAQVFEQGGVGGFPAEGPRRDEAGGRVAPREGAGTPAMRPERPALPDYAENDSFGSPLSETGWSSAGGSGGNASNAASRGMLGAIHSPCFSKAATDV